MASSRNKQDFTGGVSHHSYVTGVKTLVMRKHSIIEVTVKCKPHMEVSHAGITRSR